MVANQKDRSGHMIPNALRVQIAKEISTNFRLPGKQPVTEQMVYAVLYNLLNALMNVGVGVCGGRLLNLWLAVPKHSAPATRLCRLKHFLTVNGNYR